MRAYTAFLNAYPLVVPGAIFCAVFFPLLPFAGPYAAIIALLAAAKLTERW